MGHLLQKSTDLESLKTGTALKSLHEVNIHIFIYRLLKNKFIALAEREDGIFREILFYSSLSVKGSKVEVNRSKHLQKQQSLFCMTMQYWTFVSSLQLNNLYALKPYSVMQAYISVSNYLSLLGCSLVKLQNPSKREVGVSKSIVVTLLQWYLH